MAKTTITVNRAPVLTLWAAVVAQRLGFDADAALTLGKALAGLNAQAKGRSLGLFKPPQREGRPPPRKHGLGEEFWVDLCGRAIPAKNTDDGVRAVVKDQPIEPDGVRSYLDKAFGDDLATVQAAMTTLAATFEPNELAERSFALYERFRPQIAAGRRGWGQKGELNLDQLRSLADHR